MKLKLSLTAYWFMIFALGAQVAFSDERLQYQCRPFRGGNVDPSSEWYEIYGNAQFFTGMKITSPTPHSLFGGNDPKFLYFPSERGTRFTYWDEATQTMHTRLFKVYRRTKK